MISISILVLSTCALASAVAQPYQYGFGAFNLPGFPQPGFPQPGFPQWGVPQFGWLPPPQNNGPWITTDDNNYEIVVKAVGYKPEDMKVKIKDDSIYLRGDVMGANSKSFSYSYTMPEEGNANAATAVLTKNGYLIVTVPLTGSVGDVERTVPITQSSEVYKRGEE